MIPASRGEGFLTESHYRQAGSGTEGYGTTGFNATGFNVTGPNVAGSSDGTSHSHPPGVSQQPHTSSWCNRQVSLRGGKSPLTPLLINLWLQAVKMPMVAGGRELKAEMITPGLPVTPGECMRGPPLGQPVSRHCAR